MKKANDYAQTMNRVMGFFASISYLKSDLAEQHTEKKKQIISEIELLNANARGYLDIIREKHYDNYSTRLVVGDIEKKLTKMIEDVRSIRYNRQ